MKYPVKEGSFVLLIRNASGTDVRKYQVILNSIYKPLRYELEMKIPANKTITQPLPLINLTAENNTYRVSLAVNGVSSQAVKQQGSSDKAQDSHKGIFSIDCERQAIVQPKDQKIVNLTFKPRLKMNYSASLRMENVTTEQVIEYEIIGVGEEPEAQLLSFDQEVRKNKIYQVKIPYCKNQRCHVSQFTLEGAVYEKNFIINYEHPNFSFTLNPKKIGKYEGKLQIEDDHKIYAYRVHINVRDVI